MSKEKSKEPNAGLTIPSPSGGAIVKYDYGEDAGGGFENQTDKDQNVPFFNVLQSNSPAVQENKIEGARAGMIVNTATNDLYEATPPRGAGILVVPCITDRVFLEYVKRDKGGGFRGRHKPESKVVIESMAIAEKEGLAFGEYPMPGAPDHELTETFELYLLLCQPGEEPLPGVFGFQSTKIKHYKNWNSRLRRLTLPRFDEAGNQVGKFNPPIFAHLTRITTWLDKNSFGSFYNVSVKADQNDNLPASMLAPDDLRYQMARDFKDFVLSGKAKIDYEKADGVAGQAGGGGRSADESADPVF